MRQSKASSKCWLLLAGVSATFVLAACHHVPLNPKLDASRSEAPIPLTVGLVFSPEFQKYEFVQPLPLGERNIYPLGQASTKLLENAFAQIFKSTVILDSRDKANIDTTGLIAIVEPAIEHFKIPDEPIYGGHLSVSKSSITYRFTLFSAKGERIATWSTSGVGCSRTVAYWFTAAYASMGRAVDNAMADAVSRIKGSMDEVPELQQWLAAQPSQPNY